MTKNEIMTLATFLIIVSVICVAMAAPSPAEAQRQQYIPITRYEFPQDNVVCYRSTGGPQMVALSCVKK